MQHRIKIYMSRDLWVYMYGHSSKYKLYDAVNISMLNSFHVCRIY